jgi:preprotein translocase SecE subunit
VAKKPANKKVQTLRQKAEEADKPKKVRKLRETAASATKPVHKVAALGKKEYYLPLPKNKVGNFLNKRRSFIPKYFRESWQELRQVSWPNRKQTLQLTLAVFMFALVFAVLITTVDYGLDKLFKEVLLK